jgi:hypothetical protein
MRLALLSLAALALSACVADRLQWNLTHTKLYGGARLSQSDFEQIVMLATQHTINPMIGIAPEYTRQNRGRFAVVAGTLHEDDPCDYFTVQKSGGTWRIVRHLRLSPAVAMGMVLGQ